MNQPPLRPVTLRRAWPCFTPVRRFRKRAWCLSGLLLAALLLAFPLDASDSRALKQLFAQPPRDYSTGPLWVWNDRLSDEQIRLTLRDLAAQQVKQVWVHPRPGLMTPYLGQEWFRLWRLALQEAERLDMNVWIYDENSYPSGFAGGWVPELMPESRGRGLSLKETNRPPKWENNLLGVYRLEADQAENVTARLKAGEVLAPARYLVAAVQRAGNSPWHGGRSYVDLLYPGVTEKFLELTLEPYRREIGRQFGKRVPGVFTDEPQILPAGGLPWTEDLPRQFQRRWGYSLLDQLPGLTTPSGDWRKVRHNYFQTLNELFIERWAKPYGAYCEKHALEMTGHYWEHEWPRCLVVPDNMALYAWQQRPAIDTLMNQYQENTHAQFGNVRSVKELSSIANQLGKPRTLCEAYGAGGWDLRFEDMKRIGDWLAVLGVNTLNQHLSYVTLRGARKRDHPQSFSYHEPWWDDYHVMAGYLARLSLALAQGEQINPILVLEPTSTAWMYQGDPARLDRLGDSFFKLLLALEAAGLEYDLGCEDVLARHGRVQGPDLQVGRRRYPVLVLPPATENLNHPTAQLIERLLAAGGAVLSLGEPPTRVDGRESPRLRQAARQPNWQTVPAAEAPQALRQWAHPERFELVRAPDDPGILFHHRRVLDDGEILLLVNTSLDAPSAGSFRSQARGVEAWDLHTGSVAPYPFAATAHGVQASFTLPPSGSRLLFLSKKPLPPAPPVRGLATPVPPRGELAIRRLEPNVLTLDFVDITCGGETKTNVYVYQANQFAWQKNGLARNPWDSAVQFKDELISRTFPADSGFSASYRFVIEETVPPNLAIVIERPDLYRIQCNGKPVSMQPGEWWLDRAFGRLAIAAQAHPGENVITVQAAPFTVYHELEPAYLLGDFSLKPAPSGFVLAPPHALHAGPWNEQGHPFYAHGVSYAQTFHVPNVAGAYKLSLGAWRGSVARVIVNGQPAGHLVSPPWESDVTAALHEGDNTIEVVVIGTLKNTLGPHHGNPPLGSAWPGMFQRGPKCGPPPGQEYATVGYGLFEPFVLSAIED